MTTRWKAAASGAEDVGVACLQLVYRFPPPNYGCAQFRSNVRTEGCPLSTLDENGKPHGNAGVLCAGLEMNPCPPNARVQLQPNQINASAERSPSIARLSAATIVGQRPTRNAARHRYRLQ
jgi:hypothetical protein